MKKYLSILIFTITTSILTSCFNEARVRLLNGSIVVTDAIDYSMFKGGDTVQLEKISMEDWEIETQASDLVDTSYWVDYPGDSTGFYVDKRIGVIEWIK